MHVSLIDRISVLQYLWHLKCLFSQERKVQRDFAANHIGYDEQKGEYTESDSCFPAISLAETFNISKGLKKRCQMEYWEREVQETKAEWEWGYSEALCYEVSHTWL